MFKTITNNDLSVINNGEVAIIFSASWCGACHDLINHMEPFSSDLLSDKVFTLDVDENEELSEKYKIKSLPCVKIFSNGKEILSFSNNDTFSDIINTIVKLKGVD